MVEGGGGGGGTLRSIKMERNLHYQVPRKKKDIRLVVNVWFQDKIIWWGGRRGVGT